LKRKASVTIFTEKSGSLTCVNEQRNETGAESSMAEQQFTGESLVHALQSGALTPAPSPGIALVGMVKLSEKHGCVAFTPAGCESWVDVPVAMIESAVHIGERRCDDHRHPVVRMTLKEPADANARVLHQLLTALSQVSRSGAMRARLPGRIPPAGRGWRAGARPGRDEGTIVGGCHDVCTALLVACLDKTKISSEWCVFAYENCWRLCDLIEIFEPGPE
jgi:hypothetical protein